MLPSSLDTALLPNSSIRLMAEALKVEKIDARPVFTSVGLSPTSVLSEDVITARQEADFQRAFFLLTRAHPEHVRIWLNLGFSYRALHFGSVGKAALTSRTFADSWKNIDYVSPFTFSLGLNKPLRDGDDIVGCELWLGNVPDDMRLFTACRDFGATCNVISDVFCGDFSFVHTTIDHKDAPGIINPRLGATRSDTTSWRWSRNDSRRLLPLSDAALHGMLIREYQAYYSKEDAVARVCSLINSHALAGRFDDLDFCSVAMRIGVHPRTLQRKLRRHRLSFRDLINKARIESADRMLANGRHSLTEIACRIGYSDVTSFIRAYRNSMGRTPGSARRVEF